MRHLAATCLFLAVSCVSGPVGAESLPFPLKWNPANGSPLPGGPQSTDTVTVIRPGSPGQPWAPYVETLGQISSYVGSSLNALTSSQVNVPNGVAGLDSNGHVLASALPAGQPTPYLGQIVTRTYLPQLQYSTQATGELFTAVMARSIQIVEANTPCAAAILPNFFGEYEASAGTTIFHVAFEVPAGSAPQVLTWDGAQTGTVTAPYGITDNLCPAGGFVRGEQIATRIYATNPQGVLIDTGGQPTLPTEGALYGTAGSVSDVTAGGTFTGTGNGNLFTPIAIIGEETGPSVAGVGDSRMFGPATSNLARGETGEVGPSVGLAGIPFLNLGMPGEPASNAAQHYSVRSQLLQYVTAVVNGYGVNDFVVANESALQAYAALESLTANWLVPSGKPIFEDTVPAYSTWTVPNGTSMTNGCGNNPPQTPSPHATDIYTLNALILQAPIAGVTGLNDLASVMDDTSQGATEPVVDPNEFLAEETEPQPSTVPAGDIQYTCLHENAQGVDKIMQSQVINTTALLGTHP